jgi:hypothetical protein
MYLNTEREAGSESAPEEPSELDAIDAVVRALYESELKLSELKLSELKLSELKLSESSSATPRASRGADVPPHPGNKSSAIAEYKVGRWLFQGILIR